MFNLQTTIIFEFYAHFHLRIDILIITLSWGGSPTVGGWSKIKVWGGVAPPPPTRPPDSYFLTSHPPV